MRRRIDETPFRLPPGRKKMRSIPEENNSPCRVIQLTIKSTLWLSECICGVGAFGLQTTHMHSPSRYYGLWSNTSCAVLMSPK